MGVSKVCDDGLRYLTCCTRLRQLNLTQCAVGTEGVQDLLRALLPEKGCLEELNVDSCRSLSREERHAAGLGLQGLRKHFLL